VQEPAAVFDNVEHHAQQPAPRRGRERHRDDVCGAKLSCERCWYPCADDAIDEHASTMPDRLKQARKRAARS
jgi:hypothetical protein